MTSFRRGEWELWVAVARTSGLSGGGVLQETGADAGQEHGAGAHGRHPVGTHPLSLRHFHPALLLTLERWVGGLVCV